MIIWTTLYARKTATFISLIKDKSLSLVTAVITIIYFNKVIGLEAINSWVSVVLGLIALFIGIVSLFLSFYNLDESIKPQKETLEIMRGLDANIGNKLMDIKSGMQQGFSDLKSDIQSNKNIIESQEGDKKWGRSDVTN